MGARRARDPDARGMGSARLSRRRPPSSCCPTMRRRVPTSMRCMRSATRCPRGSGRSSIFWRTRWGGDRDARNDVRRFSRDQRAARSKAPIFQLFRQKSPGYRHLHMSRQRPPPPSASQRQPGGIIDPLQSRRSSARTHDDCEPLTAPDSTLADQAAAIWASTWSTLSAAPTVGRHTRAVIRPAWPLTAASKRSAIQSTNARTPGDTCGRFT